MSTRKCKFTYVVHIMFLLDNTVLESLPRGQVTKPPGNIYLVQEMAEHLPIHILLRDPSNTCISFTLWILMACRLCSVLISST